MSYDVSIGSFDGNYTGNLAPLFYDHIPAIQSRGGLSELHGLTGRQAAVILAEAFDRIQSTRRSLWSGDAVGEAKFCARYDAPNGWGSAIGGLIFLSQILAACAVHPRHRVTVCA